MAELVADPVEVARADDAVRAPVELRKVVGHDADDAFRLEPREEPRRVVFTEDLRTTSQIRTTQLPPQGAHRPTRR